jgi:hypothetical protein
MFFRILIFSLSLPCSDDPVLFIHTCFYFQEMISSDRLYSLAPALLVTDIPKNFFCSVVHMNIECLKAIVVELVEAVVVERAK